MKKIIAIIVAVITVSFVAEAQIPKPPTGEINDTKGRNGVVRSEAVNSGPIGTATALLLSLGAGAVAYKVNKNKRK